MTLAETKKQLHQRCLVIVTERISAAKQTMDDAQASANQEEKSSAGDKYETGRAMAQIARDQAAQQLDEALQLKNVLDRIATTSPSNKVALGSLVVTDQNRFYISVSLGKVVIDGEEYLVISPHAPIGKLLLGRGVNETIAFQNATQKIIQVF